MIILVLAVIALLAAVGIDLLLLPGHHLESSLYAVSMLIAAVRLSPWVVGMITALAVAADITVAIIQGDPLDVWPFGAFALIVVGYLAVLLSRQTLETKRRAQETVQANRRLRDFLDMVSHDLRQPLTAVIGISDWLRRTLARQGLSSEAQNAEAILRNAKSMNSMIQDLIELARLESAALEMDVKEIDLSRLIVDVSQRIGSAEDRARLRVECPEALPAVPADPDRLERVIVNLIGNALKYSPPESPVLIRLARQNGEAIVSVSDHGVGIAPEDLSHVFERFYRAKNGSRAAEGLGLGLYIASLIVKAHHGRIWAESELGKGSTFSFALPLGKT